MVTDFLADGAIRLTGSNCKILCFRPRPGTLLTTVTGEDTGEFGRWLANFIEADHRRFGLPVNWFIDAALMDGAAHEVFLQWIEWLGRRPAALRHLHAFVRTERARLTMSIAQHLADSQNAMTLHTDRERWTRLLRERIPGWSDLPVGGRMEEAPSGLKRFEELSGTVVISAPDSEFTFSRLSPSVIFSRFTGSDTGSLAHLPFDELQAMIDAAAQKPAWFLDLRKGRIVVGSVAEEWTEWLRTHHTRFVSIGMLAPPNALPLVLAIAKYRSRTTNLNVFRSEDEFEAAIRSKVPERRAVTAT